MSDVRLKLSPPWITYINKLVALFDGDPQIAFNLSQTEAGPSVVIGCNNGDKVAALQKLLPEKKEFGNVTLFIEIDGKPSNLTFPTSQKLFETAFKGNSAFAYAVSPNAEGYWWPPMTYVVFKNCVVQFFNDNLNDCHGLISTLYEDIAEEIFADVTLQGNVYYNTDVELGKLGMPLGEWP